ncbi:hypothetical protein BYT27DRAFT_7196377 [Phlegmacium glaucopus]|nr:hypothetical protein BYT27DRAFT_7196377 [Phlegmacium glaucopus]
MTSTPPPLSSTSAPTSSSPPATSTTSPKRRKVKYAKAYGYLLDPSLIYQQAIKDGTAIEGQLGCTFAQYKIRLAKHCGIKYDNIISMRNPGRDKPSMYCECDNIVLDSPYGYHRKGKGILGDDGRTTVVLHAQRINWCSNTSINYQQYLMFWSYPSCLSVRSSGPILLCISLFKSTTYYQGICPL